MIEATAAGEYREGEAAGVLKELQQYGEAEPSGTGLIGQQRRLNRQGPVFRQP